MPARITTVIPTHRRPQLLARALESVALQTFQAYEVHVYDNASGDDTAGVAGAYAARDSRFKFQTHARNLGAEKNFAFGLERVETEFFSFLSDDDLLLPEFYEKAIAALDSNPEAAMAAMGVVHTNRAGSFALEPSLAPGVHHPPDGLVGMLRLNQPAWTGTLFRTEVVRAEGLDEATIIDLDLELRIAAHHPIVVLAEPGAILTTDNHFGKCLGWAQSYERTIRKLEGDKALPEELKTLARSSLEQRLHTMVYQTGIVAARMGRIETARQAARVLSHQYRDRRRSVIVSAMAQAGRLAPRVAPLYRRLRARLGRSSASMRSDRLRAELRQRAPQLIDRLSAG